MMEHFNNTYALFVVRTDNNPLTYIITTPNLDAIGHRSVGALASFEFASEYQKGADNGVADALSQVPICHNSETVHSLLEGAIIGAVDRSEVEANEKLLCEHVRLEDEMRMQAAKLVPMHMVDKGEAQEADVVLAACRKWLKAHKDTPPQKRDALLKKYLGNQIDAEEGCTLFHVHNSLVLSKGLLYISTMPKGEVEGVLALMVPSSQHTVDLNGVHCDAGHQGQQRTLALAQEHFWWSMMAKDCKALVRGCPRCRAFEGAVPKVPLCPIRAHAPLELVHVDFTSVESTMELNKPPSVKNIPVITDNFMHYALAVVMKDQTAKAIAKVFYKRFVVVFSMPTKLGANFTSVLVKELCTAFGIQKCWTTAYHPQCNGQVEHFHQMLFRMLGKLASDKKAQWEQHLPELLQAYNSTRSAVTGYSPHYLMFRRHPHLPMDFYFPTMGSHVHSHWVPAHVEEVRRCFKEAYTEAHLQTNSEVDQQKQYNDKATSTVQLMPGDIVLMKLDTFQGKRKAKDRWSEAEYVVIRQVANDIPTYEVRDDGGNVKVTHCNRLFLVTPAKEDATPLGGSKSVSDEGAAQSALAELTPLEWNSEMPESDVDEVLSWCLTSHVLLGWIDDILRPLPSVALRPTLGGLRSGEGTSSLIDEDVH